MTAQVAYTRKILIIDDDETARHAMAMAFSDYDVTTAENGLVALKLLRDESPPNLILCDLTMPVLDGWGFCAVWHKDPILARIPVFLVSAEPDLEQIAGVLKVNGWLQKPVDLNALELIVSGRST